MNEGKVEIFKAPDATVELKVMLENETVWLNQEQMSALFERDRMVVGRHIRNVFMEGELKEDMVCADFAHTTKHGAIKGKIIKVHKYTNYHE